MSFPVAFTNALAVTPSDVTNLAVPAKAIYVGGTGNISVLMSGGQTTLFTALPTGAVIQVAALRINATNTTATALVAMW